MHPRTILLSTSLTLLVASARVLDGATPAPPVQAETPRAPAPTDDPRKDLLFAEIGQWDLEITDFLPGTEKTVHFTGTETCTVGPGREWLFSDMRLERSKDEVSAHTVIGYSTHHQRYFGSLVDNFGGGMEVFEGPSGPDPKRRVLESRLLGGDAVTRDTMRWIGDDERHTLLEVQKGEQWIRIREMRHVRRK